MGFSNKRTKIKRHNGHRMIITASQLAGCVYEEEPGWHRWRWFMRSPDGLWSGGKRTKIALAKLLYTKKFPVSNYVTLVKTGRWL